ncbi:hypothetical protein CYMTET_21326 [Cymbomonas tetramitiformis]|uniref:Uncharacterized protein n=1 Tax=Cymbomonas tetramitiformis TaxID=36881 RepID=A0AAE0G2R4_9CHLO|nr:hypothetical protein CYMTET_21326 [Cymbomonas tetramitiformis]
MVHIDWKRFVFSAFFVSVTLFGVTDSQTNSADGDDDPTLSNSHFETTQVTEWTSVTSLTGWTVGSSVNLVPNGDAAWGSLDSGNYNVYVALQGPGTYIEQTLSNLIASRNYWLSMYIATRPSDADGGTLTITVDGKPVYSGTPPNDKFIVQMENFIPNSTTVTIKVLNSSPNGDHTMFVDGFAITDGNPKLLNGDFELYDSRDVNAEANVANDDGFMYVTRMLGWDPYPDPTGGRVLIKNGAEGAAWGGSDSGSGIYYFALQTENYFIEQTVEGISTTGVYTLKFVYSARNPETCPQTCSGGNTLLAFVDGVQILEVQPVWNSWVEHEVTFGSTTSPRTSASTVIRFENRSPGVDSAVFIDNVRLPGTLLIANYDFESQSARCSVTSITSYIASGDFCIFDNSETTANEHGCTFHSQSGNTYLSMNTQNSYVEQAVGGLTQFDYYWITWKVAACAAGGSMAFYVDDVQVWIGEPPTTGFATINYVLYATSTSHKFKWQNMGTTPVYLDYLTIVRGVLPSACGRRGAKVAVRSAQGCSLRRVAGAGPKWQCGRLRGAPFGVWPARGKMAKSGRLRGAFGVWPARGAKCGSGAGEIIRDIGLFHRIQHTPPPVAMSVWVYIDSVQPQYGYYLLDARYSNTRDSRWYEGFTLGDKEAVFGFGAVGEYWNDLYIDGEPAEIHWNSVKTNVWMHLHLSSNRSVNDDWNVMSRVMTGVEEVTYGNLKGRLGSVFQWSRELSPGEVHAIATSTWDKHGYFVNFTFNPYTMGLAHLFNLEEGEGNLLFDTVHPGDTEYMGQVFPRRGNYNVGGGDPPEWVYGEAPTGLGWHVVDLPIAPPRPPSPPPSIPNPPSPPPSPRPPPYLPPSLALPIHLPYPSLPLRRGSRVHLRTLPSPATPRPPPSSTWSDAWAESLATTRWGTPPGAQVLRVVNGEIYFWQMDLGAMTLQDRGFVVTLSDQFTSGVSGFAPGSSATVTSVSDGPGFRRRALASLADGDLAPSRAVARKLLGGLYVGSFSVMDGPQYLSFAPPAAFTCQEACAAVFGAGAYYGSVNRCADSPAQFPFFPRGSLVECWLRSHSEPPQSLSRRSSGRPSAGEM